jgi:hypothetical protein
LTRPKYPSHPAGIVNERISDVGEYGSRSSTAAPTDIWFSAMRTGGERESGPGRGNREKLRRRNRPSGAVQAERQRLDLDRQKLEMERVLMAQKQQLEMQKMPAQRDALKQKSVIQNYLSGR